MNAVQALHDDTHGHLDDSKDNSELHLEVVGVGEELVTEEPLGIESEGIDTVFHWSVVAVLQDSSVVSSGVCCLVIVCSKH